MRHYNSKVSVIVVHNNNMTGNIGQTLNSVIFQSYRNVEVIVVMERKDNEWYKIANNYQKIDKRIKIIRLRKYNKSRANNIGVKKSTGKYLMFVNGGDVISDDVLKILLTSPTNFMTFDINETRLDKRGAVVNRIQIGLNGSACRGGDALKSVNGKIYKNKYWKKYHIKFRERVHMDDAYINDKYCALVSGRSHYARAGYFKQLLGK